MLSQDSRVALRAGSDPAFRHFGLGLRPVRSLRCAGVEAEVCNGHDEDCDGATDEGLADCPLCDGLVWPENRHCYRVVAEAVSWFDAEAACQGWGGHLASVASADERLFIHSLDLNNKWIGLRTGDERWTDGTALGETYYVNGEPNGPDGFCTQMQVGFAGEWNDIECDSILPEGNGFRTGSYVCEKGP